MRRRTLATLLALTAVIAFLAIAPRTPPGRAWLLGRVTTALANAGIGVSYRGSAGNLWTGVRLSDARVTAPGVQLSTRVLAIHYFLPSLITGDLPLSVSLEGVRGSLDASRLPLAGGGGSRRPPVRLHLQDLTVSDASVTVQRVPYTLPSGAVSHVHIRQQGSKLAIEAQLTTSDGSADASGTLDLAGPSFDGTVARADVRLARHWFPGAAAGTVSGPIHAGPDGVRADLSLQGGALDAIGLHPRNVSGSVTLRYPLVRADLRGTVLGGDVSARGVVNIAARHWTAQAHGSPQLLATASWLARNELPSGTALPLHGSAVTTLDASGWTTVRLAGSAEGSGSFAGLPLSALQADIRYDSSAGVKVQATGRVAGGAAVVTAATGPRATIIAVDAKQMAPLPGQSVDLQARLALGAGAPTGKLRAVDHGTLLSRDVAVTLDGGLNSDGWQVAVQGQDDAGATLQGAVALSGRDLSGELRLHALRLPALRAPLSATLKADGDLASLPLSLTLGGGQPVTLQLGPEALAADLRGTVTATLAGRRLESVQAELGPLRASGDVGLAPLGGSLDVSLARSRLEGPVTTAVDLAQGRLDLAGGTPAPHGTLHLEPTHAGALRLPALTLGLAPPPGGGGGVVATARDRRVALTVSGARARAEFAGFPLRFDGMDAALDGHASVPLGAHPLLAASSDLSLSTGQASLTVSGQGPSLRAALHAPTGTHLGPVTLARPLAMTGSIDAERRRVALTGQLGELPLAADAGVAPSPHAHVTAGSGDHALALDLGAGGWQAHGSLDAGALAHAFGLPLAGALSADLGRGPDGYRGSARLDASAPLKGHASLTGAGASLRATLSTAVDGQRVSASGTLLPDLRGTLRAGPLGPVTIDGRSVEGSGTVPSLPLAAGLALEPLPWHLTGTLAPLSIDLALGPEGHVHLDARNAARLAAAVRLPMRYGGETLTLALATAGSGPPLPAVGAPAVPLGGPLTALPLEARLLGPGGATLATASGTPASLAISGSLPAALVAAPLPRVLAPAGNLAVTGTARLGAPLSYHLAATWTAGADTLHATLTGTPGATSLTLHGAGLSLELGGGRAALTADGARVSTLFPALPLTPVLDGTLRRDPGGYAGTLTVTASPGPNGEGSLYGTLKGQGEGVRVDASGSLGPLGGSLGGTLLPAPRLHAELSAWRGAATLEADTGGPWRAVTVRGTLATRRIGAAPWLQVPQRSVALELDAADGKVSAHGDGVAVSGTLSSLSGSVALPLGVLGARERLDLSLTGPAAAPRVDGTLAGDAVTGRVTGGADAGIVADVVASRKALLPLLPLGGAPLAGDVHVTGEIDRSAHWRLDVASELAVLGRSLPLHAAVAGIGARYDGSLTLAAAAGGGGGERAPSTPVGALAHATVGGVGRRFHARLDLADVDYAALGHLLGIPLRVDATGALAVSTAPTTASLQVRATGTAAGRPLSLSGKAGEGGVALDGAYAGVDVRLGGAAAGPLDVRVRAPAADASASGSLAFTPTPALTLGGTLHGMTATAELRADPAARSGRLKLALGAASLDVSAAPAHGAVGVAVDATVPSGALAPLGVNVGATLTAAARVGDGATSLQRLALQLTAGATPVDVSLAGPLRPSARLTGSYAAPALGAKGALSLTGPANALSASVSLDTLRLLARWHGLRLAEVTADGRARVTPGRQTVTLAADRLRWTPQAGFGGKASLALGTASQPSVAPVTATLSGTGDLQVAARAGPADAPWARLDARLAARPLQARAWQGALQLQVPVGSLAHLPASGATSLTGTPSLSGSLWRPSLDGPVTLEGPVQASGTLDWQGGTAHLALSGKTLTLDAGLAHGALSATARLDGMPLGPFVPALDGATASLRAELQGGAGKPLDGSLSELRLALPGASLTGTATLHRGIRAALQARADLSATTLPGPRLKGLVHGPVVLAAPDLAHLGSGTIIAVLDVAQLGPRGSDASLDGTVQVGGTIARPEASAALKGVAPVRGSLTASVSPAARRVSLHSTLAYRRLSTDLDVRLNDGEVSARGRAAVGNAVVDLSSPSSSALQLRGSEALGGWRASLAATLDRASVSGPLGSLGAGAQGQLDLALGGTPWLAGGVRGAGIAGTRLGDLSLSSRAPGAPIRLSGGHLDARVDPGTLAWRATIDRQPLPGGPTLSGDAQGRALRGSATLQLGGTLAGHPVAVTLEASRERAIAADAQGRLLGGDLQLHAARPAGAAWQGRVELRGATLGGVTATLTGQVTGTPSGAPSLATTTRLQGAIAGSAQLLASPGTAKLSADLSGRALGGALRASGALAPALDLTLASGTAAAPGTASLRLYRHDGRLRGDGALTLTPGPVRLSLTGEGDADPVAVGVSVPAAPGLAFHGVLPDAGPVAAVRALARQGMTLEGTGATRGTLALTATPSPRARLHAVALRVATLDLSADGTVAPGGASLSGAVTLPKDLPVDGLGGIAIPYRLTWQHGAVALTSDGATGTLEVLLASSTGRGKVTADLHTLGDRPASAKVDVAFDPGKGASGAVSIEGVRVSRPQLPGLTLAANVTLASGAADGTVDVSAKHGTLHASGRWGLAGLLPARFTPSAVTGGNAELRMSTFDLASLPTVQRLAPHLTGNLSGVVRLRNETVLGQLVAPDLRVADTALPLDAQLSGTLGKIDARVKLGSSVATATLEPGSAKGLLQLNAFPAQVLAEATTGATDVSADVDGLLRFDVPYADPAASYLRMATQRVTLERAGVTTTGNLSWVYDNGAFDIVDAAFSGRGSWQAKGTVDASTLNLQLSAKDADFTPLLGLVPAFARYGVGASGSFSLDAQGSPAKPDVSLTASGLEARVAGTHYRIENGAAALKGRTLTASAHVVGVAPFGGSVDVRGQAQLSLAPLALTHTDFKFSGQAELPVVGTVTDLSGGITQPAGGSPQLALSGKLGNPFTVRGSLAPFDVSVKGTDLDLRAKPLFITSSTVNADVRVKGVKGGLSIGGELDASEVHMNIGAPSAPAASGGGTGATPAAASGASPAGTPATASTETAAASPHGPGAAATTSGNDHGSASGGASSAAGSPPSGGGARASAGGGAPSTAGSVAARAARASVHFDGLHLVAAQRVLLDAGFGTAEAALDLTLTGTAAAPKLDGSASALRGTLNFAGRDFTIDRATATFQASRGVYPTLDVQAHSDFDKQRVLGGATDLTFAAPRDSSSFRVTLSFSGQVQPNPKGPNPVSFDIRPTLSSDAEVQATSASGTSSPRPLSDAELLSLVTLGRLGVTPQLAGQSAFGTAVAQSALDTAVDVLVVSELQNALSKALGVDVVQIQTTPLSSLLGNGTQPFGVSVRVGGYVTPELFASYRLGNYNGATGSYGFSNEVNLSYDLGPLNFDLSGRLSFPAATPYHGAVPELGVGLRYAFTDNLGLEAGVDLSDLRKQARFGVSVRW